MSVTSHPNQQPQNHLSWHSHSDGVYSTKVSQLQFSIYISHHLSHSSRGHFLFHPLCTSFSHTLCGSSMGPCHAFTDSKHYTSFIHDDHLSTLHILSVVHPWGPCHAFTNSKHYTSFIHDDHLSTHHILSVVHPWGPCHASTGHLFVLAFFHDDHHQHASQTSMYVSYHLSDSSIGLFSFHPLCTSFSHSLLFIHRIVSCV